MKVLFTILLFASQAIIVFSYKSYRGYIKYTITSEENEIYKELRTLENEGYIDVWNSGINPRNIVFLAGPKDLKKVEELIRSYSLENETIRDYTIARRIRQDFLSNNDARISGLLNRSKRSLGKFENHVKYFSYSDIMILLDALKNNYPQVETEILNKTEEGRSIVLVKIINGKDLPTIWLDAGIHAREWIAPASALFFIDEILTSETKLSKMFNFFIIPLLNPDGYAYTFTRARLWRKNRRMINDCAGVDLNRNFPFQWGGSEKTMQSCGDTNPGDAPGSEKESRAVIDALEKINKEYNFIGYFTVHSYGQFLLTAYGYKAMNYPSNYDKLMSSARRAADAVAETFGYRYTVGSASDLLYEASGGSDDYVTHKYTLNYSYTIELPDQGRHGFIMPPSYIKVVGKQLVMLLENILSNWP